MNVVISDPKSKKAFSKKLEDPKIFLNKKIGEAVKLDGMGLSGFEAKITGGSDKDGFPMRPDIAGIMRKKIFMGKGIGFKPKTKALRKRINIRGNTVSKDITQVNLVLTHYGSQKLEELFGTAKAEPKEEKVSAKEQMIKESLEHVGDTALAEEAKKIKGKVKR